ncbi:MAG: flagellar basal body P-ring protein FlgI [Planctomycetota bacterium]|jgi:flagellar basal body P-ring protein FlgI
MKQYRNKVSEAIILLLVLLVVIGCGENDKQAAFEEKLDAKIKPNATIGSMAEINLPDYVPVEGYGIVGGLKGSGSSECPSQLRNYFKQYIPTQLPNDRLNIEKFLNSSDTAVVSMRGLMPVAASDDQRYFDIEVVSLENTQTMSLERGWLYKAELRSAGTSLDSKVLANGSGPVFISPPESGENNLKSGYVLAGGIRIEDFKINIHIRKPNYTIASHIRNKLINRFGKNTARAMSAGLIEIEVPDRYNKQKQRFISIVRSMYLSESPEITRQRIESLTSRLASLKEADKSEVSLEMIGKASLKSLSGLLKSEKAEVRLRAGRCMLNMGSDQGLYALRSLALDAGNPYRLDALKAITVSASRNDGSAICRKLLRDEDTNIRLVAYEELRKLSDPIVRRELIGGNFILEEIRNNHKLIFVSRSGQPRVAIFGGPLYCKENIFIRSSDGTITLNAQTGQGHILIIYKNPKKPNAEPIQIKSTFEVVDLIQALCQEPVKKTEDYRIGLGLTYEEMISILKQIVETGAIPGIGVGDFLIGPLPEIS